MTHFEFTVFCDGVVQSDNRWNYLFNLQDVPTETLIVMHEVEIIHTCLQ